MTYGDWFARTFQRHDETKTAAIYRLSLLTGVSHVSIRRAIAGSRVNPETAERLVVPSAGEVSAELLVMAPTARSKRLDSPAATGTDGE